jgi:hypothetical protein
VDAPLTVLAKARYPVADSAAGVANAVFDLRSCVNVIPANVTTPEMLTLDWNVAAPATFINPPIHAALVTPRPPEVSRDPVEMLVASVARVELTPPANGIRAVVVVWPSFVIAVDNPVAKSAVRELKVDELITVPVTTGWPVELMTNVPLPL